MSSPDPIDPTSLAHVSGGRGKDCWPKLLAVGKAKQAIRAARKGSDDEFEKAFTGYEVARAEADWACNQK